MEDVSLDENAGREEVVEKKKKVHGGDMVAECRRKHVVYYP